MKKLVGDTRLIFKCCSLYYQDGLGQQAICNRLGISRPTVSRMLTLGKELGIVRIEVKNPDNERYGQLEREVEKRFDLQETIIVDTEPLEKGTRYINSQIGRATLEFLSRILTDRDLVGVSMGLTIQNIVRSDFPIEKAIHCTFVPLLGGISASNLDIHSNYLVQEFAERFGGRSAQFFAPALFSDKMVLDGFLKEQPIQKIVRMYRSLDVIVMGIGVLDSEHSTLLESGYIDAETMKKFIAKGAVGDIALRYFDIEGKTDSFTDFNERVAGIGLDLLRKVPKRIGVAGGTHKMKAVLGAIRGGYINILVTDEACAVALLRQKCSVSK